mmetsp:Transcript_47742/g.144355  ORF Transcript_47742/g.144355 Transcript_47742/m.144355 type:complete len:210 (-) Transcript_47742:414-1043(-)
MPPRSNATRYQIPPLDQSPHRVVPQPHPRLDLLRPRPLAVSFPALSCICAAATRWRPIRNAPASYVIAAGTSTRRRTRWGHTSDGGPTPSWTTVTEVSAVAAGTTMTTAPRSRTTGRCGRWRATSPRAPLPRWTPRPSCPAWCTCADPIPPGPAGSIVATTRTFAPTTARGSCTSYPRCSTRPSPPSKFTSRPSRRTSTCVFRGPPPSA